jgi:tetratricopeptide (TPR) repeat protein
MTIETKKEKIALAKDYFLSNNFSDALELLKQLDSTHPKNSEIKLLLGVTLLRSEKHPEAISVLNQAIKIQPDIHLANYALGSALFEIQDYHAALSAYNREIELNPEYPDAYCGAGCVLNEIGNYQEAFKAGSLAIRLDQDYADALNCISVALNHMYELQQARNFSIKAINLDSSNANYLHNLALIEKDLGRTEDAIQLYHKSISLKPNYSDALFNLGLIYLSKQNFLQGWALYESRFDIEGSKDKRAKHQFNLELAESGNILLRAEQGIGDQILFGSLFNKLQDLKEFHIYIELDVRLLKIFRRSYPDLNFVEPHFPLHDDFLECNLGSIGSVFIDKIESLHKQSESFLSVDKVKAQHIKNKILKTRKDYKVCGISWNSNAKIGKNKSVELNSFIDLLRIPNIIFVNLQYGIDIKDIVRFSNLHGVEIFSFDDIDLFNDIESLFALVEACDFIVTISNINAHIAGALGKQTFLLAPFSRGRHWYWHEGLNKSLWYPSIQIFSQNAAGDWSIPINEIKEKMIEEISHV